MPCWGPEALVLVLLLVLILRMVLVLLLVLQMQVQVPTWGCGPAVGRSRRVLGGSGGSLGIVSGLEYKKKTKRNGMARFFLQE